MADLTFYKDSYIVLILAAALAFHIGAAACGFFIKNEKCSKILCTSLTVVNLLLHLFLIVFMMYKKIALDEAVLVFLISVFFYTLVHFTLYSITSAKAKRGGEGA